MTLTLVICDVEPCDSKDNTSIMEKENTKEQKKKHKSCAQVMQAEGGRHLYLLRAAGPSMGLRRALGRHDKVFCSVGVCFSCQLFFSFSVFRLFIYFIFHLYIYMCDYNIFGGKGI